MTGGFLGALQFVATVVATVVVVFAVVDVLVFVAASGVSVLFLLWVCLFWLQLCLKHSVWILYVA